MELIKKYWKQSLYVILGIVALYFVIRIATPKPQMSELDKFKLEQLDQNIQRLQKLQENLKRVEIQNADKKQVDSLLRSRYNF